ncbi:MAG: hypothetical protein KDJ87_20325 [Rhizobiaceae bacterium]|nr:hypothetical protein [Rhizobiaceae bacterium]
MQHDENEQLVEMLFRNGTLTVSGIILSFSLTFLTQWANNPIPWTLIDLPTVILLSAGIVLQIAALIRFLGHDSIRRTIYDRAARHMIMGISVTGAGVISAVVIDLLQIVA